MSKLHADQHIEVELQMDKLDLAAAESKATYEEIKEYVLEHTGLKVSSLYIAPIKEKCGIIERKNYICRNQEFQTAEMSARERNGNKGSIKTFLYDFIVA